MTEHADLDPVDARRLNRGVAIALVIGALALAIPAVLRTLGGPIAATICTLASAAAFWFVTRPLRHLR